MQQPDTDPQSAIDRALDVADAMSPQPSYGAWLEDITVDAGPHIREWDVAACYDWGDWPEAQTHFPGIDKRDVGIDAVAVRRDGAHIAIQCKARQLDADGRGDAIPKVEIDKFVAASAGDLWAERWLVTNGDNPVTDNALTTANLSGKPIKVVNIVADLRRQQEAAIVDEECPHCANPDAGGDAEPPAQTKTCMQNQAVAESVRILTEHAQSDSGGLPKGQARGKLILPCGTGKTRISLRIVEELTPPGALSIVLCPSIALVAQIRREYLQYATSDIRVMAVCSDQTAGIDKLTPAQKLRREASATSVFDNPTVDNSNVSESEVKGKVTTDAAEIAEWIQAGQNTEQISVIFGTYQSGHRVADALKQADAAATVLIADEAHRTAGLRRKAKPADNERVRDFTICHDNDRFPAKYRVYQTATPRVYDTGGAARARNPEWIVRNMDDETTFGVELYRKSYTEAVRNGWLSDYRIIALGVNDREAYEQANLMAANTESKGRQALTTTHYLRGLAFALAMGGATQGISSGDDNAGVPIKSCIAFMNTVDKSKNMTNGLQSDTVRAWLQNWLNNNLQGQAAARYSLEHLDATSKVIERDNAKDKLANATEAKPYGIINVGIFGEGTDSPSLNAVAFLEARKSPIDVIQAVGRAMRTAPGKELGYIICPILIPPNADPEEFMKTSAPEDGWQELGQILLALRAHDQRIEDKLADLLQLYVPNPPQVERTIVAIAGGEHKRISYREHQGAPGEAEQAIVRVLDGKSALADEFQPIREADAAPAPPATSAATPDDVPGENAPGDMPLAYDSAAQSNAGAPQRIAEPTQPYTPIEPTQIISGKKTADGANELRLDSVAHAKPAPDGTPGKVDIPKSKAKAKAMINKGEGIPINPNRRRRTREEIVEQSAMRMLTLTGLDEHSNAIKMNLLSKSGLVHNRVIRDLNLLEGAVSEAARHMRDDQLGAALDKHFGIDNLKPNDQRRQADGCTIAALLMMNAAMLHQRIANGRWLQGVKDLDQVKNSPNAVRETLRQWNSIIGHDFKPVLEPAVRAIEAIEDTGKLAGLERALRHIAAEAQRIAETYADMGADHAGPLFNRVMGNQASDGAFFTKPVAASIAARLTLDALGDMDYTNPEVWRNNKILDPACGSGTLLAALLADMKRRARQQGAADAAVSELQRIAVEDAIKGLDINPVSLQLAASQLTAGNHDIRYRRMGLHLMPYGPQPDDPARVSAGTLELLGQKAIVARDGQFDIADDRIASRRIWSDDAQLEDAVEAAKDARIVIMNPPFTNRAKMGEKFPKATQQALRQRADRLEQTLISNDRSMDNFVDKNSISPLFIALADKCARQDDGVLAMILPTIALTAPSAQQERIVLAQRYHIRTILTSHMPGQINLSQNTAINECVIVAIRHDGGVKPPTQFINLDKMPVDDAEVADLHESLANCTEGAIPNGWGEVSYWPAERIETGDWTAAIWRSPELAVAAAQFANDDGMDAVSESGLLPWATGQILRGSFERAEYGAPGSFPILKSKGADSQTTIQSQPDEHWIPKKRDDEIRKLNGGTYPEVDKMLRKAAHLLISAGQDSSAARLTAVASDEKYVGNGWMPVTGLSPTEAKALAVFINSTPGRLQLMRNFGRKLTFPTYSTAEAGRIRIPDIKDAAIRDALAACWERTRGEVVPQFRDGECAVRRQWDDAVASALGWDAAELGRLRRLLHAEPHVRGLGYGQWGDAPASEDDPAAE